MSVNHLRDARIGAGEEIVGQRDSERFSASESAAEADGISKTSRLVLYSERDRSRHPIATGQRGKCIDDFLLVGSDHDEDRMDTARRAFLENTNHQRHAGNFQQLLRRPLREGLHPGTASAAGNERAGNDSTFTHDYASLAGVVGASDVITSEYLAIRLR